MDKKTVLPRFDDRWTHVYLEHGRLDRDESSLAFHVKDGVVPVPVHQVSLLMLGPGTTVTHAAMRVLADHNCLVCWTGEQGVRMYAHNNGGTQFSRRLLWQAHMFCDETERLRVIRAMYVRRFAEPVPVGATIEQLRGMEGARVRAAYAKAAAESGVEWKGRNYDQDEWNHSDPVNRALSSANAALYGLCHAAILSAGYSPAIGFIHTGRMLSFVYDIADLYKTDLTVPLAFALVKDGDADVERRARMACRDLFHQTKLIERILPDIAEVLHVGDDLREDADESERRIVTLADRAEVGRVPWEPDSAGEGRAVGDGRS